MNAEKIRFRRKLIVIVLLCVAVAGGVVRHYAAPGSTTRDIGSLLLVLWVPIIGNVIAWLVSHRPRRAPPAAPPGFDAMGSFAPQAVVELELRKPALPSQDKPLGAGEYRCALVIDNEGFSARWVVPAGALLERGKSGRVEVEFLSPAMARPRFVPGAAFRVMVGDSFIADGRVIAFAPAVA